MKIDMSVQTKFTTVDADGDPEVIVDISAGVIEIRNAGNTGWIQVSLDCLDQLYEGLGRHIEETRRFQKQKEEAE